MLHCLRRALHMHQPQRSTGFEAASSRSTRVLKAVISLRSVAPFNFAFWATRGSKSVDEDRYFELGEKEFDLEEWFSVILLLSGQVGRQALMKHRQISRYLPQALQSQGRGRSTFQGCRTSHKKNRGWHLIFPSRAACSLQLSLIQDLAQTLFAILQKAGDDVFAASGPCVGF